MRKKYFSAEDQLAAKMASNRKTSKARKRKTAPPKEKQFIAWDGEGVTIGNEHIYNLLMHSQDGYMYNDLGLSTIECFDFLCDIGEEFKNYIHIIFSGSYDVNMMFRDIPKKVLERLHKTGKVYWRNFSIEYHPKKYLELKRYEPDIFIHKSRRKPNAHIVLWDVFGFFQSSFLVALDSFFTEEEKKQLGYQTIADGKEWRSEFTIGSMEETVIPYTKLEVNALVALMNRLYNDYCLHTTPPITLRRFDGAGAIAHSLLTSYGVKRYYPQNEQKPEPGKTPIPPEVMEASQHAYGGGRIELLQYGHYEGDIFYYDINSAYPSENVDLVDLSNGVWHHETENCNMLQSDPKMSLYKVWWDYTGEPTKPFYPFFYRSYHGDITFPQYGLNWVWKPEVEMVLKWNDVLKGNIQILEKWTYEPGSDIKPFSFIRDMYNIRRVLKLAGHGMQLVYKLAYNSFYGKQVQHLGYEDHQQKGDVKWRPPFFQLQNGGLITSGVRARMFDAAMQHPEAIIGFATDGLWSTRKLELPTGDDLGLWEYEMLTSGTYVQSGVYWLHQTVSKPVKVPCPIHGEYCKHTQHFRGFDKKGLREELILDGWKQGKPVVAIPTTRFIPLGQGLKLKDFSLWHTWHKIDRELKLRPTDGHGKRLERHTIKKNTKYIKEYPPVYPAEGLVPTIPNSYKVAIDKDNCIVMSEPFPLPWSAERQDYNNARIDVNLEREIQESIEETYE